MPYGFAGGLAAGFGQGVDSGTQIAEARTKREYLMRERLNEQVKVAEAAAQKMIEEGVKFITSAPNRTSPHFQPGVESYKQSAEETAAMLEQLGTPEAQQAASRIRQGLSLNFTSAKTRSEAFVAEKMGEVEGAKGMYRELYPQSSQQPSAQTEQMAQATQPQPQGEMPAPLQGGAAPPPQAQAQPLPQQSGVPNEQRFVERMLGIDPPIYEQELDKKRAASDAEFIEKAQEVVGFLEQNQVAQNYLDEGMFTGTLAGTRKEIAKAFGSDPEKVARTEAFSANRITASMRLLQEMGAGTGLSDEDRKAATLAAGGDIDTSEEGLRKILRIEREMIQEVMAKYNKRFPSMPLATPNLQIGQQPSTGAQEGAAAISKDGWVDLGGGIRLRKKAP